MTLTLEVSRLGSRISPENADLPYLLINPPLTDPTYPYHSISYLVANCAEYGFTGFRCEDANINSLNYLARREYVSGLLGEAASIRVQVASMASPSKADELRYLCALSASGLDEDFMERAIDALRTPDDFYDYPVYQDAAMAARRFINLLSLRSLPGIFSGYSLRMNGPVNYLSKVDLADSSILGQVTGGFSDYFEGPFAELLSEQEWRLVGLSVNYSSQLPFALRMARQIRVPRCGNRFWWD
jgi:anaerobic magnesium-protoporphyrin IX monomethyl ester cyclase